METQENIPTLLELMFGEAAGTALRGASPRLLLWCRAFDDWLAERRRLYSSSCCNKSLLAWRRLYRHVQAMPWELRPADIAAHVGWMQSNSFAANTITGELASISLFYRWCAEKSLDPDCEPYFNPAAAVPRPVVRQYEGAALLSRGEVDSLLAVLRADRSPLGLRDHAFYLARLLLGVPLRQLQRLQWGQIQVEEHGVSVRWLPGTEPAPIPVEVWHAIHAYLSGAGRLPAMTPETYVFAPLADPTAPQVDLGPGDWDGSRYLSTQQLRANLKRYGRLAGIPEARLEQHALRRTAARLRLDSGDSLERVQSFLASRSAPRLADYRLSLLPPLPDDPPPGQQQVREVVPPNRQPHRFQSSDTYVHGFYARSQPAEAVKAVIAEDIHGLDEQIAGLRALGRGLFERLPDAADSSASARLVELYGLVAGWLAILVRTEALLAERDGQSSTVEYFLAGLERVCQAEGETLDREALLAEAMGGDLGLALASRQLQEEIATLRYLLRNTFAAAVGSGDAEAYARMLQHYGRGCARLARLLRREKFEQGRLAAYIEQSLDAAVEQVIAGWKTG